MSRITADLDTKNKFKIALIILKALFKLDFQEITLLKSNNKGYHLIIFTNKRLKINEIYKLREKLNDDKQRIRLDKARRKGKQTLFNSKKYYKRKGNLEKYLLTDKL